MNEYRHVYIPMPDVYVQAGVDVFKELERTKDDKQNAVVIPTSFMSRLQAEANRGRTGAIDILYDIMNREQEAVEYEPSLRRVVNEQAGLAQYLLVQDTNGGADAVESLTKKVETLFPSTTHKPQVLTTVPGDVITYKARGIRAEIPEFLYLSPEILHDGIITGGTEFMEELFAHRPDYEIPIEQAEEILQRTWEKDLFPNQFIKVPSKHGYQYARVIVDLQRDKHGSVNGYENPRIVGLHPRTRNVGGRHSTTPAEQRWVMHVGQQSLTDIVGIQPLDMEQYLALEHALLDKDIEVVFLTGQQGSGKTVLAYAAAIDQILEYKERYAELRGHPSLQGRYEQIVVFKPNDPMGGADRNVGFLPGDLYAKVKNILASFADAHKISQLGQTIPFEELFCHPKFETKDFPQRNKEAGEKKFGPRGEGGTLPKHNAAIELVHSADTRGRSIPNSVFIIDEAQNFTPYELRTLLERTSDNTKAIVMGDVEQLDHRGNTRYNNALLSAIKHFQGKPFVAQLHLSRNYRGTISKATQGWRAHT